MAEVSFSFIFRVVKPNKVTSTHAFIAIVYCVLRSM